MKQHINLRHGKIKCQIWVNRDTYQQNNNPGVALPDLTRAWMEERVGRSRGGLGAGSGCLVEGWVQEAVSSWWRAGWVSAVREGEIWVGGGRPVEGWVASSRKSWRGRLGGI
jgi:hypothetical protein